MISLVVGDGVDSKLIVEPVFFVVIGTSGVLAAGGFSVAWGLLVLDFSVAGVVVGSSVVENQFGEVEVCQVVSVVEAALP